MPEQNTPLAAASPGESVGEHRDRLKAYYEPAMAALHEDFKNNPEPCEARSERLLAELPVPLVMLGEPSMIREVNPVESLREYFPAAGGASAKDDPLLP